MKVAVLPPLGMIAATERNADRSRVAIERNANRSRVATERNANRSRVATSLSVLLRRA